MAFINADVHKAYGPLFKPNNFVSDNATQADLKKHAKNTIIALLKIPNEPLAQQAYLTGHKSTADIYLYVMLRWAKEFAIDLWSYNNLNAFIKRIEDDAGVTAAIEQEGVEKIVSL